MNQERTVPTQEQRKCQKYDADQGLWLPKKAFATRGEALDQVIAHAARGERNVVPYTCAKHGWHVGHIR